MRSVVVLVELPDEFDGASARDVEVAINHRLVDEAGYLPDGEPLQTVRVTSTVVTNLDALRISVEQVAGFLSDDNDRIKSADDLYLVADLLSHAPAHTLNRCDPQPEQVVDSKVVHGFCAHCGSAKEPNANYADNCGIVSSTFRFCANCGKPKDANRNYVHNECLCR